MTRLERRVSLTLAHVFGLRMLGFFIVLPVLAEHARLLPGGQSGLLVGLAMGAAGLAQALLQIPLGWASDRFGRRSVIALGLCCVLAGSLVCAFATDLPSLIAGRILQGCGAVSAAISALIADHTRDSQRTKAMAMVGIGIGLSFTLSLALAPWLYAHAAMAGIFLLTAFLALVSIGLVASVPAGDVGVLPAGGSSRVPAGDVGVLTRSSTALPALAGSSFWSSLRTVGRDARLWRLDLGIFVLNAVQMAMFVVVPGFIVRSSGLALAEHWRLYLPVVLLSFLLALPMLRRAELRGELGKLMRAAVWVLLAVQVGWLVLMMGGGSVAPGMAEGAVAAGSGLSGGALAEVPAASGSVMEFSVQDWIMVSAAVILLVFFVGFNVLEAALPAQVSRVAAGAQRGTAMGVFNTAQSLGLFVGGAVGGVLGGGVLGARLHAAGVFLFCAALLMALILAIGRQGFSSGSYQAPSATAPAQGPGVAGST